MLMYLKFNKKINKQMKIKINNNKIIIKMNFKTNNLINNYKI